MFSPTQVMVDLSTQKPFCSCWTYGASGSVDSSGLCGHKSPFLSGCHHYVCGVKLVDVVKEQIGVNREEPTDAFSTIREEFSSTRRIEPLTG